MSYGHEYDNYSLMIGRFQPFHEGHLEIIRKCAQESDNLNIGIGSAQYSHSLENPFTAGERYLMIKNTLDDEGIDNYCIVPVEDLNRFSIWVAHVTSMMPPFAYVYSNNPFTRRLFEESGFHIRESPMYNREVYSGTEVRRRIVADEDWRSLVPGPVAKVIEEIDGIGRMKDLSGEY